MSTHNYMYIPEAPPHNSSYSLYSHHTSHPCTLAVSGADPSPSLQIPVPPAASCRGLGTGSLDCKIEI